jgi:hypothetical protein
MNAMSAFWVDAVQSHMLMVDSLVQVQDQEVIDLIRLQLKLNYSSELRNAKILSMFAILRLLQLPEACRIHIWDSNKSQKAPLKIFMFQPITSAWESSHPMRIP